ncbi:hypothetical protein B0T20DRAFT_70484 [Sordaria brevicollis]|uniref:Uncharacterized protein n=1 Tax=Sordaria brevicollis TaxID=83679 RepID=A0AAE0U5S2_SORBR|nr:hypothetical protein B0T20DRAFT_70484 [Sordaria brevicollis]
MILEVVRWNPAVERVPMSPWCRVFGAALGCAWRTERQSRMRLAPALCRRRTLLVFSLLDRHGKPEELLFLSFPAPATRQWNKKLRGRRPRCPWDLSSLYPKSVLRQFIRASPLRVPVLLSVGKAPDSVKTLYKWFRRAKQHLGARSSTAFSGHKRIGQPRTLVPCIGDIRGNVVRARNEAAKSGANADPTLTTLTVVNDMDACGRVTQVP